MARWIVALSFVGLVTAGLLADDRKTATHGGSKLPQLWSKLGLSDDQKQQVYSIQTDFRAKIEDLRSQVRKLEHEERAAISKVLTDAQRARLKELAKEKAEGAAGVEEEKSAPDKKP